MFDGLSLTWAWQPWPIVLLALICLLYGWGFWRARGSATQEAPVRYTHLALFAAAIIVLGLTLVSPLTTVGRTQFFLVHAIQVVVITTICAPLALLACPATLLRPLQTIPVLRVLVRFVVSPLVASILFNGVFLLWHVPPFFQATMVDENLYQMSLLLLFIMALLPWFPLAGSLQNLRGMNYPQRIFYVFLDGQPIDIYALLLMLTGWHVYPLYAQPAQLGITALADQVTGGVILLIPGLVDLAVMTPNFHYWMRQIEARTRLADEKRQQDMALEDEDEDQVYQEQVPQAK